jgi:two-component system response regulator WspF
MRIGIVNDLALARAVLRKVVQSVPAYSVAWEAVDGADAVTKAAADRPDVILMDLMMPVMDGAEATRQIMQKSPCPILIVTASVGVNHGKVYEALGAGGLDAVKTPTFGPCGAVAGAEPLLKRLARQNLSKANFTPAGGVLLLPPPGKPAAAAGFPLLAIGASTGGPDAVARVLAAVGPNSPAAVVVVQHIGSDFTAGLADWLKDRTGLSVKVAGRGERPIAGRVYVAGGDEHLILDPDRRFAYTAEPAAAVFRPNIDVFFESAAANWPDGGVGVLLTGMLRDGARGLLTLRNRGWHTIAQDEATCVVYGMPKAAAELKAAKEILPLDAIGPAARVQLAPKGR